MKRILPLILAALLLCGCSVPAASQPVASEEAPAATAPQQAKPVITETPEIAFESRFDAETLITLSDSGMDVTGPNSMAVFGSNDIVYYEDRDTYDSGNPYGEGKSADKHTAEEAAAHYVVNITEPGAYRITGKLSAGQIRIDLGKDAYEDETAVVELILDNADITCTVAPAILFENVYECDGNWSTDTAKPDVDTSAAGANLVLEGENTVNGAYVAKIYKDKDGEKKLWKQDGAIYSYMSMNVFGPGKLTLNAANEGLDTELHLTINGGDISILSDNDGINTNEDGVSVTTINAGKLHIVAGLGKEGDGIDSNGYLVINGGTVISSAKPASDAGLDSDLGSFIHGGTVIALGSSMDWAESDSKQVTMNLQFSQQQSGAIRITDEAGNEIYTFDPTADPVLGSYGRTYQGVILSTPAFSVGDSYQIYVAGNQMQYTSTDVMRGPGGMGGFGGMGGQMPEGFDPSQMPEGFGKGEMPEGFAGFNGGEVPEGFEGQFPGNLDGQMPNWGEGEMPSMPTGGMPEGFSGGRGDGKGRGDREQPASTAGSTTFYMQDKVNFFSGITAVK